MEENLKKKENVMKNFIMMLGLVSSLVALNGCIADIDGNEVAVVETTSGPQSQTLSAGYHLLWGIKNDVHKYPVNDQTYVVGEQPKKVSGGFGHDVDDKELVIKTKDSQKAWVSFTLQYSLNRTKIIHPCSDNKATLCGVHIEVREDWEARWLRPELSRIIKDLASTYSAKDIYAAKRKEFNDGIEKALHENKSLREKGIKLGIFVLDQVRLEKNYEEAISDTMLQEQLKEKAQKERAKAEEQAKAVGAQAQADVEKRRAAADASKLERIAAAEAERFEREQEAIGLLAKGEAQNKVERGKREALYSGPAGERRMKVEIARANADAAKGLFKNAKVVGGTTVESMLQQLLSGFSSGK